MSSCPARAASISAVRPLPCTGPFPVSVAGGGKAQRSPADGACLTHVLRVHVRSVGQQQRDTLLTGADRGQVQRRVLVAFLWRGRGSHNATARGPSAWHTSSASGSAPALSRSETMSSLPCRHAACRATRPKCCAGAGVSPASEAVPGPRATYVLRVHVLPLAHQLAYCVVLVRGAGRVEGQCGFYPSALARLAFRGQLLLRQGLRLHVPNQGLDIDREIVTRASGGGRFRGFRHAGRQRSAPCFSLIIPQRHARTITNTRGRWKTSGLVRSGASGDPTL